MSHTPKILILLLAAALSACVAPRLGEETVRYDNTIRQPTPATTFIQIYASREDIDFKFSVIGEVTASPMKLERDFGYDPIELLREQALLRGRD
jgi:hypothetical protein